MTGKELTVGELKKILDNYDDDKTIVLCIFESEDEFDEHKDYMVTSKKNWSDDRRTAKYNANLIDVGDIHFLGESWVTLCGINGDFE